MRAATSITTLLAGALCGVKADDANKTFAEICAENGFSFETHSVTTEDGYILSLWRIPGLVNEEPPTNPKPPVLFQHGVFDSAYCWISNYADVAPAFVAARAGYDVWLGNSRGNTYSRAHVTYDPDHDEDEFWAFSWYEMGMYDQPAFIDHIRGQTGDQKIAYIGHSQGTTQMFVGLAEKEDSYFADKLSLYVALGPVFDIPNTEAGLLTFMTEFYDIVADGAWLFGIHEFLGANWLTTTATQLFCEYVTSICELLLSFFTTSETDLDDKDRFAVYMGHQPNGASVQQLLHYAQNIREARFQVWAPDYTDWFDKQEKRHTDLIPTETITQVPVAIYCGSEDILADCTDAVVNAQNIGADVIHYEEIPAGHLTFIVGKDMTFFTEGVMGLLADYHPVSNPHHHDHSYLQ